MMNRLVLPAGPSLLYALRMETIRIAALYRFAKFPEPERLVEALHQACEREGVKGTLLVAQEGINGTIAGTPDGLTRALDAIRDHHRASGA